MSPVSPLDEEFVHDRTLAATVETGVAALWKLGRVYGGRRRLADAGGEGEGDGEGDGEGEGEDEEDRFLLLTLAVVGVVFVFYGMCIYQIVKMWLLGKLCPRNEEEEVVEGTAGEAANADTVLLHEGQVINLSGDQRRAVLEAIFSETSKAVTESEVFKKKRRKRKKESVEESQVPLDVEIPGVSTAGTDPSMDAGKSAGNPAFLDFEENLDLEDPLSVSEGEFHIVHQQDEDPDPEIEDEVGVVVRDDDDDDDDPLSQGEDESDIVDQDEGDRPSHGEDQTDIVGQVEADSASRNDEDDDRERDDETGEEKIGAEVHDVENPAMAASDSFDQGGRETPADLQIQTSHSVDSGSHLAGSHDVAGACTPRKNNVRNRMISPTHDEGTPVVRNTAGFPCMPVEPPAAALSMGGVPVPNFPMYPASRVPLPYDSISPRSMRNSDSQLNALDHPGLALPTLPSFVPPRPRTNLRNPHATVPEETKEEITSGLDDASSAAAGEIENSSVQYEEYDFDDDDDSSLRTNESAYGGGSVGTGSLSRTYALTKKDSIATLASGTASEYTYDDESTGDNVCPICLGGYKAGDTLIVSKHCVHIFHKDCILEWLERHDECPVCRADMVTDSEMSAAATSVIGRTRLYLAATNSPHTPLGRGPSAFRVTPRPLQPRRTSPNSPPALGSPASVLRGNMERFPTSRDR